MKPCVAQAPILEPGADPAIPVTHSIWLTTLGDEDWIGKQIMSAEYALIAREALLIRDLSISVQRFDVIGVHSKSAQLL
jgi:hypothetical protein